MRNILSKRLAATLSALILVACSSPSPYFMGIEASAQEVSGLRFDVYRREYLAQAIRLSGRLPGGEAAIKAAAAIAIKAATGCRVNLANLEGDKEVITASLTC